MVILVVAGNHQQFLDYVTERVRGFGLDHRLFRYVSRPEETYGYGVIGEGIIDIVYHGEWWLSEIYDDVSAWNRLEMMKAFVEERITPAELILYGALNRPEDDVTLTGGGIDNGRTGGQLRARLNMRIKARWPNDVMGMGATGKAKGKVAKPNRRGRKAHV